LKILIIEDDPMSRRLVQKALEPLGHALAYVGDGQEAWEKLQTEYFPLVVADWMMPRMDGVELVRRLRAELARDHYHYVILLTGRAERRDRLAAFEAGVDDYVTKPFDREELQFRVRAGERVIRLQGELADRNARLKKMTRIDGLTGIPNRRAFDELFERFHAQAVRYQQFLGLAIADIDRFKQYNDRFGHEAGDLALRAVAKVLDGSLRTSDSVFRYGGEEFACLMPMTDEEGVRTAVERLRVRVAGESIFNPCNPPHNLVTVSIGYACFDPREPGKRSELFRQADLAMYAAKQAGRNCSRIFIPSDPPVRSGVSREDSRSVPESSPEPGGRDSATGR